MQFETASSESFSKIASSAIKKESKEPDVKSTATKSPPAVPKVSLSKADPMEGVTEDTVLAKLVNADQPEADNDADVPMDDQNSPSFTNNGVFPDGSVPVSGPPPTDGEEAF